MGEPVRVLLVDDDEDEWIITRDLFREMGGAYAVEWVSSFEAARDAVLRADHDVYLLDYHLGAWTALELLEEAKRARCSAPMIVLTGARDREVDLAAMGAGAADFLDKGGLSAAMLERALRYAVERKRSEERLRHSDEHVRKLQEIESRLQDAVRVRDEFLSIAAHELKTPLTPLSLQLSLLTRTLRDTGPQVREMLDVARRQTERLGQLVENLLDMSRIARHTLQLNRERVDLADLARDLCRRFHAQAAATGSSLSVTARGEATGNWDRSQLEQVVTNLLSNAIKYGRGGPVELGVDADPATARLWVQDHGIGVTPESVQRIFGAFERAVSSRHYGGLGLGLYVANEIVCAHHGRIEVASHPGAGSKFTVVLPRVA